MGTDIHPTIFVLEPWCTEWVEVATPPNARNYEFFWWLAGVRWGSDEPVPYDHPRGIPPDMGISETDVVMILGGGQSPGWYSLAEFKMLPRPEEPSTRRYYKRWLKLMKTIAEVYQVDDDKVRVLFQFDS
jgi:hypothetical protein